MANSRVMITKDELVEKAIKAMENAMAYLSLRNESMFYLDWGEASAYEDMLTEYFNCYLDEENEHYARMLELANEAKFED